MTSSIQPGNAALTDIDQLAVNNPASVGEKRKNEDLSNKKKAAGYMWRLR